MVFLWGDHPWRESAKSGIRAYPTVLTPSWSVRTKSYSESKALKKDRGTPRHILRDCNWIRRAQHTWTCEPGSHESAQAGSLHFDCSQNFEQFASPPSDSWISDALALSGRKEPGSWQTWGPSKHPGFVKGSFRTRAVNLARRRGSEASCHLSLHFLSLLLVILKKHSEIGWMDEYLVGGVWWVDGWVDEWMNDSDSASSSSV